MIHAWQAELERVGLICGLLVAGCCLLSAAAPAAARAAPAPAALAVVLMLMSI